MANKPLFLIVDDDSPADQAARLQQSFELAGLGGNVSWATSPAEMFQTIKTNAPTLVLLDHHWPEVSIDKVLQGLLRASPDTRVVLYTGKPINPSTIIECARYGVAEYLVKGELAGDVLARKLSMLAGDPDNTLGKRSAPSGTFLQLIQEAEKAVKDLDAERGLRQILESEVATLKSSAHERVTEQLVRFLSVVVYCIVLAILLVYIANSITPTSGIALGLFVVAALAGVFLLDRSISQLIFKNGKWRLHMQRNNEKR